MVYLTREKAKFTINSYNYLKESSIFSIYELSIERIWIWLDRTTTNKKLCLYAPADTTVIALYVAF